MFPCWIESSRDNLIGNLKDESLYDLWLSQKRMNIINSLTRKGCSGCMMSCYDEVFDRGLSKEHIIDKVKKMKKATDYKRVINKVLQSLKSQITRSKLRYRFYISYRGSLFNLLKRRLLGVFSNPKYLKQNVQAEQETVLLEIRQLKRKIKNEIQSL